jgi:UDP-glucose 4-epimerase
MSRIIAVVTGGAGFLGSHMVDLLLRKNITVRVIDNFSTSSKNNLKHHKLNKKLSIFNLDIRKLKKNSKIFSRAMYVYHFAGIGDIVPSIESPEDYMSVNVQGTLAVLEAARYAKVKKFIYAASSTCYGIARVPTDEKHQINPQYPYALSKYIGEQTCMHWHKVFNLPINSIRIFNAYGIRSRTSGAYGAVFGVFLRQKIANKPFTVVGNGNQKRDFVYASDVARAFYQVGKSKYKGKIYNVGSDNPQSINKLVRLLDGKKINIKKRPGEPNCTWANIKKIKKEIGWKPQISLEEGVKIMVKNISYWRNAPLWNKKSISKATKYWFKYLS